jgi:hypothetical protein
MALLRVHWRRTVDFAHLLAAVAAVNLSLLAGDSGSSCESRGRYVNVSRHYNKELS